MLYFVVDACRFCPAVTADGLGVIVVCQYKITPPFSVMGLCSALTEPQYSPSILSSKDSSHMKLISQYCNEFTFCQTAHRHRLDEDYFENKFACYTRDEDKEKFFSVESSIVYTWNSLATLLKNHYINIKSTWPNMQITIFAFVKLL